MKLWLVYVMGAVLSWGFYGPALHAGQKAVGSSLKALLCVGAAYFLIAVLVPVATLWSSGQSLKMDGKGALLATLAGALGAAGAIAIIFSFRSGGTPLVVMPLVFGGAPLINVLTSMALHPPQAAPHPMLYVGFVLASVGAGLVLYYKPA